MTLLRQRMAEDMAIRNLSPNTRASYISQVSLFARHFGRSPDLLGPEQIRDYRLFLTTEKPLAPASIRIAVSALRFLYGVTLHRDWDIPEVLPAPSSPPSCRSCGAPRRSPDSPTQSASATTARS